MADFKALYWYNVKTGKWVISDYCLNKIAWRVVGHLYDYSYSVYTVECNIGNIMNFMRNCHGSE